MNYRDQNLDKQMNILKKNIILTIGIKIDKQMNLLKRILYDYLAHPLANRECCINM